MEPKTPPSEAREKTPQERIDALRERLADLRRKDAHALAKPETGMPRTLEKQIAVLEEMVELLSVTRPTEGTR